MDSARRLVLPSLAELLDRMSIEQIREICDAQHGASHEAEIAGLEHDLDLIFAEAGTELDARFIRLVIALAQVNLHIWHTKVIMQTEPARFQECLKLAHQLNGIRNQLKNRVKASAGLEQGIPEKTNIGTDQLESWAILNPQECAPVTAQRQYQFTLTDLIDALTIHQIREVLLPENQRSDYVQEVEKLVRDVDLLLSQRRPKLSGRTMRLITLLAQANLHVWHLKDQMQQAPDQYYGLLEQAQELNGIRNHVRNLLMEELSEGTPTNQRTTFLDYDEDKWYSTMIKGLERSETGKASPSPTLTLGDFARLFGCIPEEIPPGSRQIIGSKDFSYQVLDPATRDQVITAILRRIDSDQLWVSGPDRRDVWEKGWSEALQEYEMGRDFTALTPKFIRPNQIVRLNGDYVLPANPEFEFNVVDVYRRWAFKKYLKDRKAIYEFGCGSCQHFPVLADLFPDVAIHGLDWVAASIEIANRLACDAGWNITGHLFNLYSPDEQLELDSDCGVFTVGTMEQLGRDFDSFLQFLLRKRPAIVMHMETIRELYDPAHLSDYLAIRYDQKRNYLDGYLSRLRQLEERGKIQILNVQRIMFGSLYHDSYSLVVWRPN